MMSDSTNKKSVQHIIIANRLTDGVVVYFTGSGWSEKVDLALKSENDNFLIAEANDAVSGENILNIELVKIAADTPEITPTIMREKIRSHGPTINYLPENQITAREDNVSV